MNNESQLLPHDRIFEKLIPKKRSLKDLFYLKLNNWQKWMLTGLLVLFELAIIFQVSFYFTDNTYYLYFGTIFILIMHLLLFVYLVASSFKDITKQLMEPESELLAKTITQFSEDMNQAKWISKSFDKITIEFAQQRLLMLGEHLKQRIFLMVGVIDKLGLIPIAVSAYLAYKKLETEGSNLDLVFLQWAGCGLVFLYLVAISLFKVAQGFQRHSLVLKLALDLKQQDALNNG